MADRYWVGGSGTWDATTTTNWATTSGGAGGASAPTFEDNVIFDADSNVGTDPFTVTVSGSVSTPAVCNDFTAGSLDGAMTLTFPVASTRLDCYGSMTLPATNFSWTNIGAGSATVFRATSTGKTITTNGVTLPNMSLIFDGVGGAWTLGSALASSVATRSISVDNGTFNSGNYNITWGALTVNVVGTQVIDLGSSTVTAGNSLTPVNFTETAGLTFNAGTSTITSSAASPTFNGGGQTFYNVSFTSAANGTTTINGANTFNDLSQTSRGATGIRIVSIGADQTVSGTLTLGAANQNIRRIQVVSNTIGTQRTITLNGTLATLADCDFRDIATAGTVGTWTGTRIGNGLNNSGITFDAAKDVYWNSAAGGNWTQAVWALSSGGATSLDNFPLAQDKIIIEDTGLDSGATVTFINGGWWVGELDISTRTLPMTFANGSTVAFIYKNVTLSSAVTMTGTALWNFQGQSTTQILDVNTATFVPPITINSPSGTLQLAENTTCSATVTLTSGTLDLNDFDLTCNVFISTNTNTRVIAFGTGEINLTGNAAIIWNTNTATGLTLSGTPTVNATYSGSTGTRNIIFGTIATGTEANTPNLNVTDGSDIVGAGATYRNLNFTGFTGTWAGATAKQIFGDLTISSGMTITTTGEMRFQKGSGTQTLTSAGKTFDFNILQNNPGATLQLQDNFTVGSARIFNLTAGTLDINGKVLSAGLFGSSNSNTRALAFGTNGELAVTGSGTTAFNAGDSTGLTVTGTTSTINMASASPKTFVGGGATYPITLKQGGLGTLSITGANTFNDMTNDVSPCTIVFPASTTNSFYNFNVNGTPGNLIELRSSTPGTRYTLARLA
jgi:hypothetical protein